MEVKFTLEGGNLLFHLYRQPMQAGLHATDIVVSATREHVINYRDAYKKFKKANPDYKLKWEDLDIEVTPEPIEEPFAPDLDVDNSIENTLSALFEAPNEVAEAQQNQEVVAESVEEEAPKKKLFSRKKKE